MIFCTFDGFRKNRPKSIYNRRSFYYNRNVRLFIKSASARRSKSAPVHSTVCLSYHVFHKKKRGFCFYRKFFCTYFSIVPQIHVQLLWKYRKNDCRIYAKPWKLPDDDPSLALDLLPAETAGCQPRPQEQTPIFRRRFRWSKCSVQKEAILWEKNSAA